MKSKGPTPATTLIAFDGLSHGGAERHIVDLACGMTRLGLRRVVVATAGGALQAELEAAGVEHEYIPLSKYAPWALLLRARRLDRLVRKHRAGVLHSHSRLNNAACSLALRLFRTPAAHIATAHNVYPDKHRLGFWPSPTICVSAAAQDYVRRHSAAETCVIVNGVRQPKFNRSGNEVRQEFGIAPGARVIVNVGRLSEQKAQYLLIEAFARLVARGVADCHLLLVGEGELRGRLEQLVATHALRSRVTFAGARDDVFDLLAASDIFALSSRWEGLGLVLVEAAACGLPLVAFKVGGVVEAVEDGHNGLLVPPENIEALSDALRVLVLDEGARRRMGAAGRALYERKFSLEKCVLATNDVYAEVAQDKADRTT